MPHTINGIGTWYYGKKNIFQRQGSCEHCGRNATLTSYDTTLFFTVFFIPLIPLGKKRILDQCSACSRHRSLPLKEWESARAQSMEAAQMSLRQSPSNPQTAHDFLGACAAFQSRDIFEQSARDIRRHHSGNADVLNHLAATYFNFAMWADAEDATRAAMKLNDTQDGREFLAYTLIKQGKPDDAAYYLSHLYSASQSQKVGYLFLLAEAFQAQGDHRKALQVLDQCAGAVPGLAQDKEFKKLRKISDKNRDSRKKIKHKELASGNVTIKSGSRATSWVAIAIGPLILIGLLAAYFATAHFTGHEREVYLVNGLTKPYSVRIAGKEYGLPSLQPVPVKITEGVVTVEVVDEPYAIETQSATIKTPFWSRPFLNRTYILNPDRTAPIIYEKTYYVEEGKEDKVEVPDGERKYHVGEFMYEFSGLDYKFREFPDEIQMSAGSRTQAKDRVALLSKSGNIYTSNILFHLAISDEKDKAIALSKRRLEFEPDQIDFLNYLSRTLPGEEFIAFVKPGLEVRPLRVNWHRAYQSVMESAMPDHDLAAEYKSLLVKEPDNKDMHYLLGRVLDDSDAALAELRLASQDPEPSVFGLGALAFRLVAQGIYAEAVPWAEKAHALDPKNDIALGTLRNALLGSGGMEKYLAFLAEQQRLDPRIYHWYEEQVIVETLQGRHDKAEETIQRAVRAIVTSNTATGGDQGESYVAKGMRTTSAYVQGDVQKYKELETQGNAEYMPFHVALTLGDVELAVKSLEEYIEYEDAEWTELLLLYTALMAKGDEARAGKYLDTAIEYLKDGDKNDRIAAAWLKGETTPSMRDVAAYPRVPDEKAIIVMAIGARRPEMRAACFTLARKLNIDRDYPWHFINGITSTVATPGGN